MLTQLNELLLVSKNLKEENRGVELSEVHTNETTNNNFFLNVENLNKLSPQIIHLFNLSKKIRKTSCTEKQSITDNVKFIREEVF